MTVEEINHKVRIIYSLVGTLESDREVAHEFYELCIKFRANPGVIKDCALKANCDIKELEELFLKYSNPRVDAKQNKYYIANFLSQKSWSR